MGKCLKLYEVVSGKERASFEVQGNWPVTCAFSPDGKLLAVPAGEVSVRLIHLGAK
jgi:hypothetical protein